MYKVDNETVIPATVPRNFPWGSRNTRDCIIMNEESITFNYHSNKNTLKAIARRPLIILTNSLGFQFTYHLDTFEYDKVHKTTSYSGNIIFNLDMTVNGHNRKEFVWEDSDGKKYFSYHQNFEIAYDYHLTTVSFRYPS